MSAFNLNPPSVGFKHDVAQNKQRLSKMLQLHGYSACREALVLIEDHYTSSTKYESMEDFISQLNKIITFETDADSSIIDPDLAHLAIEKLRQPPKQQVNIEDDDNNQIVIHEDSLPATLTVKVKNVQCDELETRTPSTNSTTRFSEKQSSDFKLTTLATLTGSSQPSIRCICFGLLVKDISKIDGYMLIDSTGRVPLRITPDTTFRNRLAYTNCIVLVEGVYVNPNDILFAANIGLPPILLEPVQDKSLACRDEQLVVILKDLYLDDEDVCNALDMLFTGYNSMKEPPIAFILIGNFTREHCAPEIFRIHMKKLIRILRSCDKLQSCHFIFVPGQSDTGPPLPPSNSLSNRSNNFIMPRPALTKEQLPLNLLRMSNFDHVHMSTNPCHIYLCERLITVVAQPYLKELRRYLLHDLSDHREELFETAKQIILSNGHLSAGIAKTFHSSMNLWHRPDLMILADNEAIGNKYDYSSSKQHDTSFATVPSFSIQYNQFKVYYVKSGEIEDSQVSSDAYHDIEEDEPVQVNEYEALD